MPSMYSDVTLGGDTNIPLDPITGNANFSLSVDQPRRYYFTFRVVSTPADYDLTVTSQMIDIYPQSYVTPSISTTKSVQMTFVADFTSVVGSDDEYFAAAIFNILVPTYTNVTFSNFVVSQGM